MLLTDRPLVQRDIEIAAPPVVVWELVTDPAKMGTFSPENTGGSWDPPFTEGAPGARFTSENSREDMRWSRRSTVLTWSPPRQFAFAVTDPDDPAGDPARPIAVWRYQLHPLRDERTWLCESVDFGTARSPLTDRIAEVPGKHERVVAARCREHARNIDATLRAIKAAAESR